MRKRIQVPVSTYSLNMETYAETSTRNKRLCSPQRRGRKDHLCKNIERTSGGLELASPFRAFSSISGGWRGQLALSGGFPRKFMSGSSAAAPRLTSPIYNFSLHPCALSNAHKYADELCSQTEPAKFPNCALPKNTACPLDFRLDRNDADNKISPDVCVYISVDISTRLSTRTFIWRIFIGNSRFSLEIPLCNKRSRPPRSGRTLFRVSFGLVDPKCSAVFHVSTFII